MTLHTLYHWITNGEKTTADLTDDETEVPRNFFLNVANGSLTKLADKLASPGLVLTWLFAVLGVPTYLTGWLVPIRRAGALLPQLVFAGYVREMSVRKWGWVAGAVGQTVALALMAVFAFTLKGVTVGIAILGALLLMSMARGFSSIAFKDVLAKTIPEGKRGTLLATRSLIGGILTLVAGLLLNRFFGEDQDLATYASLIMVAAGLWVLAILFFTLIREPEGQVAVQRDAVQQIQAGWRALHDHPGFRQFIVARCLILTIALSQPYYVLLARREIGDSINGLGIYIIAWSLAEIVSSIFWGRLADRSSRRAMAFGSSLAGISGLLTLGAVVLKFTQDSVYIFGVLLFILGLAQAGARLGRKTYLVDSTPTEQRPTLGAVTNTIVGLVMLGGGGLGLIAHFAGLQILILLLAGLALVAAVVSWRLPEASTLHERLQTVQVDTG